MKSVLAVVLAGLALAAASCPNECSSRGTCYQDTKCLCWTGFTGSDCSLRSCPEAEAWAMDNSSPHTNTECANRGLCDRSTGLCKCFPGFTGEACERQSCPNDCSGHGKCKTAQDLSMYTPGASLDWDEKSIVACECDGGFFGSDCSLRKCPAGDDPETICDQVSKTEQVQRITAGVALDLANNVAGGGVSDVVAIRNADFAVSFKTFGGTNFTTRRIPEIFGSVTGTPTFVTAANIGSNTGTSTTDDLLETALESLPNFAIRDVTVTETDPANIATSEFDVTFHHSQDAQNNYGAQNLLVCHQPNSCPFPGCQPKFTQLYGVAAWSVDVSAADVAITTATHGVLQTKFAGALEAPANAALFARFTGASLLSCPTGKTCTGATSTTFEAGITVIVETAQAGTSGTFVTKVFVKTYGYGVGADQNALTVSGAQPAGYFAANNIGAPVAGNLLTGAVYAGELTSGNLADFDISDFIPGASLEFHSSAIGGSAQAFATHIGYKRGYCTVSDVTESGAAFDNSDSENIECSGRGECDRNSGVCSCFAGFTGASCGVQTVLV